MRNATFFIGSCLVAVFCASALGKSQDTCTAVQAHAAEDAVSIVSSWDDLYRKFLKYRHGDEGSIAEGFSDAVAQLLGNHWREKKKIESLIKKDAGFRAFIIRHINATLLLVQLEKIAQNAQENCSQGLETFCDEIIKAVDDARKDMPPRSATITAPKPELAPDITKPH